MTVENPTGSDAGASITDRLERYFAAEDSPEPEQKAQGNDGGADDDEYIDDTSNDGKPDPDANADQDDKPTGDESGDDQETQISTADLAKFLGLDESMIDVDSDGNPIIKTKIDGKDGSAKFADVLKSYQLQGHVDNKAREVADQQKALQQRMAEADQAVKARLDQMDNVIALAGQEMMREFQSVDWQWLRENNPGEYAARMADFQGRQQQLQSYAKQSEAEKKALEEKQLESLKAFAAQERQRLAEVIPEWKDAAIAKQEADAIKEWGVKNGFEQHELQAIIRAPHVSALRKAMLYDKLQQAKPETEKRVRTAPKLVKAGQAQAQSREQVTVRSLKENVRKSGGKTDAVAAFLMATNRA